MRLRDVKALRAAVLVSLALTASGSWTRSAGAEEKKAAAPAKAEASKPEGAKPDATAPAPGTPEVQRETTEATGEKSYQFGAVEVEGRLKAPQILYFLRRVRAELRSGQLGHRSFMPELYDTRRSEALR
jgi:hypothetical protein